MGSFIWFGQKKCVDSVASDRSLIHTKNILWNQKNKGTPAFHGVTSMSGVTSMFSNTCTPPIGHAGNQT